MYQILHKELINEPPVTAMCHGSTVLPLPNGTVLAAWFGGSVEGADDTAIWLAKRAENGWGTPVKIAGSNEPHWNPVLLHMPSGAITLFYKVGRKIATWRTMQCISADNGETWSAPIEMVAGDVGGRGPVRNKVLRLSSGRLLAPASVEGDIWRSFADRSDDGGKSWTQSNFVAIQDLQYKAGEKTAQDSDIQVSEQSFYGRGVIQPTLWQSANGNVHMLMRSTEGRIYRSDSVDGGETWCDAYPTSLPSNNSGIDVARLKNGTLVLAYNPVEKTWGPRTPLSLAYSKDDGETWTRLVDLSIGDGEFSYPAIVPQGDVLHLTYTNGRKNILYWQITIAE